MAILPKKHPNHPSLPSWNHAQFKSSPKLLRLQYALQTLSRVIEAQVPLEGRRGIEYLHRR